MRANRPEADAGQRQLGQHPITPKALYNAGCIPQVDGWRYEKLNDPCIQMRPCMRAANALFPAR